MYKIGGDGLILVADKTRPAVERQATEPTAESRLVTALRRGERDAFDRLYALYAPMVHGIILARVPATEVDDLVQDVFLIALRKLETLREAAALGGWLSTIARNRAMDFHRRKRETEELNENIALHNRPGADVEATRVLDRIREMPEAYRETLVLRLVEGMTGPEIAARTGLTPASVRVNLHRGMKMLRRRLGMEE